MFFILNYLLSQKFFNEEQINNYDDIQDVVINCELRLSQLILKNNWNINCIYPLYKNIDYRKQTEFISHEIPFENEILIFPKNKE